jgi:hypothetical protein
MKRFALIGLLVTVPLISFGQKRGYGLFGFDVGFPINAPSSVKSGMGIALGYEQKIGLKSTWILQTIPTQFPLDAMYTQYYFVPVLFGFKHYSIESFKGLYIEADTGLSWIYASASVPQKSVRFAFVPAVGYHFKTTEIGFRLNLVQGYPYFSVRLAVKF